MSFFVELYDDDTDDPLCARGEMDYPYQAEQFVIDALEECTWLASAKAFHGSSPGKDVKVHDRTLFAEWKVITKDGKRDLERLL